MGLSELGPWLQETRAWVDATLDAAMPAEDVRPARLHEAMRYSVFGGGKRLRPALVRLVAEAFGGPLEAAAAPAAAVELIHTYSLVHDDLPAMDDDDLRRGRATCHVVYGDALAILVGDALQSLAFELVASGQRAGESVRTLATAAGSLGMVGGQVLDIESDDGAIDWAAVSELQSLKTAAMLRASAELGGIAAGAGEAELALVRQFGMSLGRAFQVVDDVLDVTASAEVLGKTPGKDAALHRGTSVAALGLEGARKLGAELADEAREACASLGWGTNSRAEQLIRFTLERSH